MIAEFSYDDLVTHLVRLGVPQDRAERSAADDIARRASAPIVLPTPGLSDADAAFIAGKKPQKTKVHVGADRFAVCKATLSREFDVLTATFELPPRTKKNSLRWFGVQSVAYTRFRNAIVEAVKESKKDLALPLPDQHYNLAVTFYVDTPGEKADLFGLLQAIADALQDAEVITNDWYFKTTDGSRIVTGDERPRVELTIAPIEA